MMKILRLILVLLPFASLGQTYQTGLTINAPRGIDKRSDSIAAGKSVPFTTLAGANASTISAYRFEGLVKHLKINGKLVSYAYQNGIADSNLVPIPGDLSTDGTVSGYKNIPYNDSALMVRARFDSLITGNYNNLYADSLFSFATFNTSIKQRAYNKLKALNIRNVVLNSDSRGWFNQATDYQHGFFYLFGADMQTLDGQVVSEDALTNIVASTDHGVTFTGSFPLTYDGASGSGVAFTNGAIMSYVGTYDSVGFWFNHGTVGMILNYSTESGHFAYDTIKSTGSYFSGVKTPNLSSHTYTITANGYVPITVIYHAPRKDRTGGKLGLTFQNDAIPGYMTRDNIQHLPDVVGQVANNNGQKTAIINFFGANDFNNYSAAAFKAYYQQILQAQIKAGLIPMVMFEPKPAAVTFPFETYESYEEAAKDVAKKMGVAFISARPEDFVANGFLPSANVHENNAGMVRLSQYDSYGVANYLRELPATPIGDDIIAGDYVTLNTINGLKQLTVNIPRGDIDANLHLNYPDIDAGDSITDKKFKIGRTYHGFYGQATGTGVALGWPNDKPIISFKKTAVFTGDLDHPPVVVYECKDLTGTDWLKIDSYAGVAWYQSSFAISGASNTLTGGTVDNRPVVILQNNVVSTLLKNGSAFFGNAGYSIDFFGGSPSLSNFGFGVNTLQGINYCYGNVALGQRVAYGALYDSSSVFLGEGTAENSVNLKHVYSLGAGSLLGGRANLRNVVLLGDSCDMDASNYLNAFNGFFIKAQIGNSFANPKNVKVCIYKRIPVEALDVVGKIRADTIPITYINLLGVVWDTIDHVFKRQLLSSTTTSATFTATAANYTNTSSGGVTVVSANYIKIGNIVIATYGITCTPTAPATLTSFSVTLPFTTTTTFGNTGGTANIYSGTAVYNISGQVNIYDGSNAGITFIPPTIDGTTIYATIQYTL